MNGLLLIKDYLNMLKAKMEKLFGGNVHNKAVTQGNEMSQPDGCKCSFRTYMLGDGCDVCNPALALEYANETIIELEKQRDELLYALNCAVSQVKYLHDKFQETGSGNGFIAQWEALIAKCEKTK